MALIVPAAAHKRSITEVYVNNDFDPILVGAWVEPECHPGTMKITLKKKNADGVWVKVITKRANCRLGWGYTANFDALAGDKRCKAKAKFTSQNHATLSKTSDPFDC